MLTKDGWPRGRAQLALVCWLSAAALAIAGCNKLARQVYYPAPTPLFMEEGLRVESAEVGSRGSGVGDQETADRIQQLPPPTQPPGQLPGPQPVVPEFLPSGQPISPYEALPGAMGFLNGVTLAQAIDEAMNASMAVRQEMENVVQAQADVRTASIIPNPQLMMLSSLLPWPGHPFNPVRQGGPPQYDIWATWPIDWYLFGKRRAEIEAKARAVDVSAAEFADFVRQRIAQTVATYFAVLEARALLQVARENAANLERVVNLTQNRFINDAAARIDVERAQIVLSNARRDIRSAEVTLATARSQLRALMGREGLDPTFDVAGTLEIARPLPPPPIEFAVSAADRSRPDLLAAARRIDQAAADVAVEDLRRFPTLGVQTGWTYQDQKKAIGFAGEPSWNVGFTFPLPITDRNQGNRWKARSALAQAQLALDARRIQVRSEVEQALVAYDAAYRIVTSDAPQQLEAARSVRNRIEEAYREGGRTLFELLDAERTFRDTFRLQINAQISYWRAIHQLNAVVGQQIVP